MTVRLTEVAEAELNDIWDWNDQRYGPDHAAEYVHFLETGMERLAKGIETGRPVAGFPGLLSATFRRGRGDGHVVIYRVNKDLNVLDVAHIYHTKMDIPGRLAAEPL